MRYLFGDLLYVLVLPLSVMAFGALLAALIACMALL